MNKLITISSKSRKKHIMLIIELFFSFIALFLVFAFVFRIIDNSKEPLGFDYKNINMLNINIPNIGNDSIEERTIQELKDFIKADVNVENIDKLYSSQFFNQDAYMHPHKLKYENIEVPKDMIELMGATDGIDKLFNIKIIEGRWFNDEDNASKNRPVVISEKLKGYFFGNKNAIGKTIIYCNWKCTIVGVCNDFKHKGEYSQLNPLFITRDTKVEGLLYKAGWHCNSGSNCMSSDYIKLKDASISKMSELSKKVATKFPGFSIQFRPLEKDHKAYITRTWGPLIIILAIFLFLFINVLFGLFGILWYNISLRKSEIGIRMATGANKTHIFKHFIGEIVQLTSLGIIPGIIVAVQFPILKAFDIETTVYVLAMLPAAVIIYLLVVLCALFPTSQAAKIQPALALHDE
jgi:putative ABC transport system permease protein